MSEIICDKCNSKNPQNNQFCSNCGEAMTSNMNNSNEIKSQMAYYSHGKTWYILPILFGIIGGLVSYFAIRQKNPKMAGLNIIFGVCQTFVIILLIIAGSNADLENVEQDEGLCAIASTPEEYEECINSQSKEISDVKPLDIVNIQDNGYALNMAKLETPLIISISPDQKFVSEICELDGEDLSFIAKIQDSTGSINHINGLVRFVQYDLDGNVLDSVVSEIIHNGDTRSVVSAHPDFASCAAEIIKIEDDACTKQQLFAKSKSGYDGIGCIIPQEYWSTQCLDKDRDCTNAVYIYP